MSDSVCRKEIREGIKKQEFKNLSLDTQRKYETFYSDNTKNTSVQQNSDSTCASSDVLQKAAKTNIFMNDELPVLKKSKEILNAVKNHQVTLIVGEPGSGKTTQIPQLLLKYTKFWPIAITQPRRVAAISLASRVLYELKNSNYFKNDIDKLYIGGIVGYSVRFLHKASKDTCIKFLTDGCLLRETILNTSLRRYKTIIIDEAHERSVRTDILLGFLKQLLVERPKLRIIIMSATLSYHIFTEFFGDNTATIIVPGRQFPLTIYHSVKSQEDYLDALVNCILQIHISKPIGSGDILVFLPGQQEIETIRLSLENKKKELQTILIEMSSYKSVINGLKKIKKKRSWEEFKNFDLNFIDKNKNTEFNNYKNNLNDKQIKYLYEIKNILLNNNLDNLNNIKNIIFDCEYNDINNNTNIMNINNIEELINFIILPMYSALSSEEQEKIFYKTNKNYRKIILATNIAETSLTIPGISYVIDTGYHKLKTYNPLSLIETLELKQISRAMANQRAGRAARNNPGECYRLYTEEDYYNMNIQIEPEIKRCNITQVILELKAIGIKNIIDFPFLTQPNLNTLNTCINFLIRIEALDKEKNLTDFGRKLACFPIAPEHGNFLLNSFNFNCTSEALTLISILNSDPIFLGQNYNNLENSKNDIIISRKKILCISSDHITLLNCYNLWEKNIKDKYNFCKYFGLNQKSLIKAKNIRKQLKVRKLIFNINFKDIILSPSIGISSIPSLLIGSFENDKNIEKNLLDNFRQCLIKSFPLNIARLDNSVKSEENYSTSHYIIENTKTPVSLHPSCCLFGKQNKPHELVKTTKTYMRTVTSVETEWIKKYHPKLLNLNHNNLEKKKFRNK